MARIHAIHLSSKGQEALDRVERVQALENRGLAGDKHAKPGSKRSVLFMALEDVQAFDLTPGAVREQVTTEGFDLYGPAAGARFRAGEVVFEMGGPCAPCEYMERIRPGLQKAIDGRRGRFATVVEEGALAVGDAIVLEARV